ncbi:MAG TPA: hypothetical protein VIY08_14635 [Candidatus Nitrosocosmicus sp.]
MQNFQSLLKQLDFSLLYIHKLQLKTNIPREHYNELDLPTKEKDNIIKYRYERINQSHGNPDVEFNIYSNGTIMIYLSCSNNPFRLINEEDVLIIFAYVNSYVNT